MSSTSPTVGVLSSDERERVLFEWNARAEENSAEHCVHALFERRAAATPDALAVVTDQGALSYRELAERSNVLGRHLQELGVGPEDCVALCLERSPELIVALLAILKAGAAYLPLEPSYPRARIEFILNDAAPKIILTQDALRSLLPADRTTLSLDGDSAVIAANSSAALANPATPQNRAYVLYTSGSTGTPKGVEVPHRAIERLVCDVDYVALGPRETILQAAPVAFDASTFEIWGALLNGGRVVVYPEPIPTAQGLSRAIESHGVTTMWLTASLFNAVIDENPLALSGLRQLLTGGEALSVPHVRRALEALPSTRIINGYGPTETTTFAVCHTIVGTLAADLTSIPIGRAIRQTRLYVLDAALEPVPIGAVGELYIGGKGVARGYLNRPELTAERFVDDPFRPGERVYRTGDLVRFDDTGLLEYVGRADQQVKIRGFRIELGEIESALAGLPDVSRALVVARADARGEKRLVAYVILREAADRPSVSELRLALSERLPEYMLPAAFVWLAEFPITLNGKIDQRALPEPELERPELAVEYLAPRNPLEHKLAQVWADALGFANIGVHDNLFDLGANSLLAVRTAARIERVHRVVLPVVKVFERPTVAGQAAYLRDLETGGETARIVRSARSARTIERESGVAIIGMAGRFPDAPDVATLWLNLCAGKEAVRFFLDSELDPQLAADLVSDSSYVKARGVLEDADLFDAGFFGIPPKEAKLMDPQQRVLLEVAWETLEHAGYVPETFAGSIGIFAGKYNNSYYAENVSKRPELIEELGAFLTMVANEKDYIATRIAHRLNLRGPALSIHTACSTSLVAVVQAVQNLLLGQCDMALAGGVSITVPVRSGYLYQAGAMLSPDGHTRSFDARAQGTVFSDAAAMVLLKRLGDAQRDGDTIYAVIRGAAINNDGGDKASFTAPSVEGQAAVVAAAHAQAGIDPRDISFVEAHGTATPLGDPIEVEALTRAFRLGTHDKGFCALGSVKSNLGHPVIAAGATGLIKTALALTTKLLPPSLFFETPNPAIDFATSPFYVQRELTAWPAGPRPRLAGVSSFGVGGTNAHVVVEEPPASAPSSVERTTQLLVLSARSEAALRHASQRLATALESLPELALADVSFTLHAGRKPFAFRRCVTADDPREAAAALRDQAPSRRSSARKSLGAASRVAFLFPGQGAQYPGMGEALYRGHPIFRAHVDAGAELLAPTLGLDLRDVVFARGAAATASEHLRQTACTQSALFVIEYALARLWSSFGLEPAALLGHSVGEFVCAVLASVMTFEDALQLVAARGRMMQALPPGSMLSVRLPATEVERELVSELSLAADNGPALCVVSGPSAAIEALAMRFQTHEVTCRTLQTSHAFHSSMMDPVVKPFQALVAKVDLSAPKIPIVSSTTGDWLRADEAVDPAYWARHLRLPVRFTSGVKKLWEAPHDVLLEVGPRGTLATLARQQLTDPTRQFCFTSLGDSDRDAWHTLLGTAGNLWTLGIPLDAAALHGPSSRRRVALPSYPFERQRFWVEPRVPAPRASERTASDFVPPLALAPGAAPIPPITMPAATSTSTVAITSEEPMPSEPRRESILSALRELVEETSGLEIAASDHATSFVELGLDSLFLTQLALALRKKFPVNVTFRELLESYPDLASLAGHIEDTLPPEQQPASAPLPASAPSPIAAEPHGPAEITVTPTTLPLSPSAGLSAPPGSVQSLIEQQLQVMTQQLAVLSELAKAPAATSSEITRLAAVTALESPAPRATLPPSKAISANVEVAAADGSRIELRPTPAVTGLVDEEPTGKMASYDVKKAFGAIARITTAKTDELTPKQKAKLEAFTRRYNAKTKGSKSFTQEHRHVVADPRVVTGFRPAIKELVYPIVVERSAGPRLWDVDGNEYVDALNGFGLNLFGWQPDFVTKAIEEQLHKGHEVGPQTPLQAEVARLICEATGFERVGFCNTGSEAVMGCARIARTVTGRSKVAIFAGAYHGIFDEVVVRGTKKLRSIPAAPGIMASSSENVLVLDYGTEETLRVLRARASELAAIIVEPVQSRRPDFQPREFLQALRELTTSAGIVYVFDEVVTGFRTGPGGAQEFFGVRADLAAYGKVVGGGLPIGVIAGKTEFMDALDGGQWQYGDDSVPPVGVTYFAGTFVRHPLALAAARAVLQHLKACGPALQQVLNERTSAFAAELNAFAEGQGAPVQIKHFASLWKTFYTAPQAFGDLLFFMMRDRGVHIYDGFPCFFTTSHTDAEFAFIANAFKESVFEMQEAGFLPERRTAPVSAVDSSKPPLPGARLGRDPSGAPAWYVPHPSQAGKYVKLERN